MKRSKLEITGSRVHKILNKTLSQKLTKKEYENLIDLINTMLEITQQRGLEVRYSFNEGETFTRVS